MTTVAFLQNQWGRITPERQAGVMAELERMAKEWADATGWEVLR